MYNVINYIDYYDFMHIFHLIRLTHICVCTFHIFTIIKCKGHPATSGGGPRGSG